MAVNSITGSTTSQQESVISNNTLGKDEFLKLLVTELRYQDAMNPMQDREFIAQMAQFSSLEQMQNLNTTMTEGLDILTENQCETYSGLNTLLSVILGTQAVDQFNQGVNLLGKEATYTVDGEEKTGIVTAMKKVDGQYMAVIGGEEVPLLQIDYVR